MTMFFKQHNYFERVSHLHTGVLRVLIKESILLFYHSLFMKLLAVCKEGMSSGGKDTETHWKLL